MVAHVQRQFETKIKANPGERSVVARISTISVDRDGDVMLPSGVDLSDFKKNPVVLLVHDSGRMPIGTATEIENRHDGIIAKTVFAERPKSHPDAVEWVPDTVFDLFEQGVLRGFSVGFMIDEAREPNRRDINRFGEGLKRIIVKWRLLEFSVVPIPANQDALAMAVTKGFLDGSWTAEALKLTDPFSMHHKTRARRLVVPYTLKDRIGAPLKVPL